MSAQSTPLTITVGFLDDIGLPLGVEFGKRFPTVGYDRSRKQVVVAACREFRERGAGGDGSRLLRGLR